MKKINQLRLLFIIFSGLAIITLVLSCSYFSPNAGPASPSKSMESTSDTTASSKLPPNPVYQDLNVFMYDDPANIDSSTFPITPIEAMGVTGIAPDEVDISKYVLSVDGLVGTPLTLNYEAILKYPAISEVVLLICPGVFVDNAEWTGVPMTTLLKDANIKPEANHVNFNAMDGYSYSISLQDVQREGVFLAYNVNGKTLPINHGYPIRLVLKGKYGSQWVKWINHIEIK